MWMWYLTYVKYLTPLNTNSNTETFFLIFKDPSHVESEMEISDGATVTFGMYLWRRRKIYVMLKILSTEFKIKPGHGCDNTNSRVPTSDEKAKLYCCIYCLRRYQKLERHLRTVHKNEDDVKKFVALPPGKFDKLVMNYHSSCSIVFQSLPFALGIWYKFRWSVVKPVFKTPPISSTSKQFRKIVTICRF